MGKEIDKKVLFGSLIAIIIIILPSINSVISVQTDNKSISDVSPLFYIRTDRAIGKESQNLIKSNYIGNKNTVTIPLTFHSKATITQNVLQKIKEIDIRLFNRLFTYLKKATHNSENPPSEVLKAIHLIQEETEESIHPEKLNMETIMCETLYCQSIRCNTAFAGCIAFNIFKELVKTLENIYRVTDTIPVFEGTITLMLYNVLVKLYKAYTTTLPQN